MRFRVTGGTWRPFLLVPQSMKDSHLTGGPYRYLSGTCCRIYKMIISNPELVLSRPDASLPVKGVQWTLWFTIPERDRKVFNMTLQSGFLCSFDFEGHKFITLVVMDS